MVGNENSGRHPVTHLDYATGSQAKIDKPSNLDEHASWFWTEIVVELINMGVAKNIDTPALVMMAT